MLLPFARSKRNCKLRHAPESGLSNGQNRELPVSMVSDADLDDAESAEQAAAEQTMLSLGSMGDLLQGKLIDSRAPLA